MSILVALKGELDRRLYWIQIRQEALRFISYLHLVRKKAAN